MVDKEPAVAAVTTSRKAKSKAKKEIDPNEIDNDPDKAAAEIARVLKEEEERTAKKRLTRLQQVELTTMIRKGLADGLHPKVVRDGCAKIFGVTTKVVEKYLKVVNAELLKQTGYYAAQVKEIVEKLFMDVAKDKNATTNERMRAAIELKDLFGIRHEPEDTAAAERLAVEEHMRRMDSMSIQELSEFAYQLKHNTLTSERLYDPFIEEQTPVRKRKRARHLP